MYINRYCHFYHVQILGFTLRRIVLIALHHYRQSAVIRLTLKGLSLGNEV